MPMQFRQGSQGSYDRVDKPEIAPLRERSPVAAIWTMWLLGIALPAVGSVAIYAYRQPLEEIIIGLPLILMAILLLAQFRGLALALEFRKSANEQLRTEGARFVIAIAIMYAIGVAQLLFGSG